MKKFLTIAAILCMATAANAKTVNGAFHEVATEASLFNTVATYDFNDLSVADYYDQDGGGKVSEGDVILGAFVLDELKSGVGSAPLTDVSGIYAIEVKKVTEIAGTGTFSVLFTSLNSTNVTDLGLGSELDYSGGEMFSLWQGGTSTNPNNNPPTGAFSDPRYSDGDLYATFTAPTYTIIFGGNDLDDLLDFSSALSPGSFLNQPLVTKKDGTGDGGEAIKDIKIKTELGGDILANGSIQNTPQTSITGDYLFNDTAVYRVTANIVPLPAAAFAGLPMLAGLALLRRRRNA